jgi:hypothetical protein
MHVFLRPYINWNSIQYKRINMLCFLLTDFMLCFVHQRSKRSRTIDINSEIVDYPVRYQIIDKRTKMVLEETIGHTLTSGIHQTWHRTSAVFTDKVNNTVVHLLGEVMLSKKTAKQSVVTKYWNDYVQEENKRSRIYPAISPIQDSHSITTNEVSVSEHIAETESIFPVTSPSQDSHSTANEVSMRTVQTLNSLETCVAPVVPLGQEIANASAEEKRNEVHERPLYSSYFETIEESIHSHYLRFAQSTDAETHNVRVLLHSINTISSIDLFGVFNIILEPV